jgi:hypothetical protein
MSHARKVCVHERIAYAIDLSSKPTNAYLNSQQTHTFAPIKVGLPAPAATRASRACSTKKEGAKLHAGVLS